MIYSVDIVESPGWKGRFQKFHARCRETGDEGIFTDPEHQIARKISAGLTQDGEMHTFRDGVRSLVCPSIFAMAATRTAFGDKDGWRLRKYEEHPNVL